MLLLFPQVVSLTSGSGANGPAAAQEKGPPWLSESGGVDFWRWGVVQVRMDVHRRPVLRPKKDLRGFAGSETPPPSPLVRLELTSTRPTLETAQGQIDGFFSQFPFKYYSKEVASVGN